MQRRIAERMQAMVLSATRSPLVAATLDVPRPGPSQILIRVRACGVCRTDLHLVDGELPQARLPVIPGHEIVGVVQEVGPDVSGFASGDRVGVPWVGYTCGRCRYCAAGRENLCDTARFTGCTIDGGYAEFAVADSRFCFKLPSGYSDVELAPWLCAGLIGYRALRMAGEARKLGIYGFGAAAHIVMQLCRHEQRKVYAFTRPGDGRAQAFALDLGASWAGPSDLPAPCELDAAILFAPIGALVPKALGDIAKGGTVVCAGIHMTDIPEFPYAALWGERRICSVANLTRRDGIDFIRLAQQANIRTKPVPYALSAANDALAALRQGSLTGAAVLTIT